MAATKAARGGKIVSAYFNELILYGGVPTPRHKVEAHLEETGCTRRMVDRYMQGAQLATDRGLGLRGESCVVIGADEYPGEIWEPIDEETFDRLRAEEKAAA